MSEMSSLFLALLLGLFACVGQVVTEALFTHGRLSLADGLHGLIRELASC